MGSPPLLKYFPYSQPTTVVCGGGGLNKYQAPAPDTGERGPFLAGFTLYSSPVRVRRGRSASASFWFVAYCMPSHFEILLLHAYYLSQDVTPVLGTAPGQ